MKLAWAAGVRSWHRVPSGRQALAGRLSRIVAPLKSAPRLITAAYKRGTITPPPVPDSLRKRQDPPADRPPPGSEGKGKLVRAEGLEPSRALRPNGFSYRLRLSPSLLFCQGLGSGLSLHRVPDTFPVFRCCPSSLYTFPAVSGRTWLGIAMLQGSPTLSSSASPVSRRALKFAFKSVRCNYN
jgi:hypothetical protein